MKAGYWVGAVLVLAMGAVGYWLGGAGGIVDQGGGWQDEQARLLEADAPCTLDASGCRFIADDQVMTVRVQDPIRPLVPFKVYLETTRSPEMAEVRFTMDDMDMGINQFRFAPISEGLWETMAVLPVCTVDRADWRATFRLKLDGGYYRMEVVFEVGRG